MKKYRIKSLIVVALVALSAVAAPHKSILSLKESITDDNIQFPYSFETNTQELMKNWYLQNYAVLDKDVENKDPGDVSDATYISRLKTIPSGIELPFNQVVKSYIERYTHRERTLVAEMLGMSPYYMPIFEQALEKRGMPLELKYIPVIESALDPNAVSPVGASGLWQFMLETARNQGLEVNSLVDERRDPYRSSDAAADYFKKLYDIYGDWSLAIAAYNCGPGNVNKALLRAGDGSAKPDFWEIYNYLPRETRGYVPAFIAATYVMHYYKEHNISPSLATKPLLIDTVKVNQRLNFAQISKVLNIPIDEIRILNPQYRHDVIPGDARPYTLALPSQQVYSFILVEDSINSYRPDLYAARDVREPGTPNDAPTANNYGYSAPTMQAPAQPATQTVAAQPATQVAAAQPAATPATAAAATKYYKVKRGEDIESVASSFGISVDQLMTLNSLTRRHVSRGQVLKVPDVAQKAAAAPSQPAQPAQPAQAAQPQPTPAPVAATPVASSSASGTYTPYAGSYSIDDEVTREISESYSHKSSRSSDDSEATGHKTTRKTEQESKASQDDGSKKKASRKQARDDEAESSKSSSGKKARARKAAHDDEQEQASSKRSRSSKASRGDDGEETSSKKKSRRSRARQQDDEPKMDAHEVKRGESLERIARNNDMTVDELKKANPKIKGNHIEPGQTVNIPVKKKSKATKSRKSRENDDEASASSKKKRSKRSSSSDDEEKSSKKKSRRNR